MESELSHRNLSQQGERETCTGTAATGGKWLKLEPGMLVPPELHQTAPSSSLLLTLLLAAPKSLSCQPPHWHEGSLCLGISPFSGECTEDLQVELAVT